MKTAVLVLALASLAIVPRAGAATLFGLIDTGELFRSVDNGATWTPFATLPVRDATALSARLTASELFMLSRSGGVYRSTDAGANWTAVGAIAVPDAEDMVIGPGGELVVLTSTGSVLESVDQGVSFTPLAALTGANFVSVARTTPELRYFAMTRTGEVYESEDGGTTWTPKGVFTASDAIRLRSVAGTLYALTETGDVYSSDDRATTWTPVGTLSQVGMRGLAANGSMLAAATREGHVATSTNGSIWSWVGSINQLVLGSLASDTPAITGVGDRAARGPLALGQPYPNPSAGELSFTLRLDSAADASLALFDLSGRRVASRPARRFGAGAQLETWDPGPLPAGLYTLRVTTEDGRVATRRCVTMR